MKDFSTMKPREIEGYFRELIRKEFGNVVEDHAAINSSHGSYHIAFDDAGNTFMFDFKKKSAAKVAKSIRALK